MRLWVTAFCLAAFTLTLTAQPNLGTMAKSEPPALQAHSAAPPVPQVVKDLPVRKVVLYKNGVGYFEHAGPSAAISASRSTSLRRSLMTSCNRSPCLTKTAGGSQASTTTPRHHWPNNSRRSPLE